MTINKDINERQEQAFQEFLKDLPNLTDTFDTKVMQLAHAKGVTLGIEIATSLLKRQAD